MTLTGCEPNQTASIFEAVFVLSQFRKRGTSPSVPRFSSKIGVDTPSDLFYIVSMQSRTNRPDPLGEFETLVLMAVVRLGSEAYGMRIHHELESTARRRCSLGALYTTLDRLEVKGYVASQVGEPTPERGGRAKKYFQIKAHGERALKESYAATRRMAEGIEPLLGGGL